MDPAFSSALKNIPGLFYVTSTSFLESVGDGVTAEFKEVLAGRPHVILQAGTDVLDAADTVRGELQKARGIKGVVILGDYTHVPSHAFMSIDPALYDRMVHDKVYPASDVDRWWVWNDDIYGCVGGKFDMPDLPVSRLPTIPATTRAPFSMDAQPKVYGVRSSDFPFARYVYEQLEAIQAAGPAALLAIDVSPPAAEDATDSGDSTSDSVAVGASDLGADLVYLVLHGVPNRFTFHGGSGTYPIVVSAANIGDARTRPAVVFGGICYGALIVNRSAKRYRKKHKEALKPLEVTASAPLTFMNMGVNAFVGFTALHQLSDEDSREAVEILGAPLHKYFWQNITVRKMAPAEALFRAKAQTVMSLDPDNTSSLALAKTLKAVWSATCIGFGW